MENSRKKLIDSTEQDSGKDYRWKDLTFSFWIFGEKGEMGCPPYLKKTIPGDIINIYQYPESCSCPHNGDGSETRLTRSRYRPDHKLLNKYKARECLVPVWSYNRARDYFSRALTRAAVEKVRAFYYACKSKNEQDLDQNLWESLNNEPPTNQIYSAPLVTEESVKAFELDDDVGLILGKTFYNFVPSRKKQCDANNLDSRLVPGDAHCEYLMSPTYKTSNELVNGIYKLYKEALHSTLLDYMRENGPEADDKRLELWRKRAADRWQTILGGEDEVRRFAALFDGCAPEEAVKIPLGKILHGFLEGRAGKAGCMVEEHQLGLFNRNVRAFARRAIRNGLFGKGEGFGKSSQTTVSELPVDDEKNKVFSPCGSKNISRKERENLEKESENRWIVGFLYMLSNKRGERP